MGKTSLYWRWLFPLLHRSGRAWFAHPKASREAARRACLRANLTLVLCGATLSSWPALSTGAWSGLLGASLLAEGLCAWKCRSVVGVGLGLAGVSLLGVGLSHWLADPAASNDALSLVALALGTVGTLAQSHMFSALASAKQMEQQLKPLREGAGATLPLPSRGDPPWTVWELAWFCHLAPASHSARHRANVLENLPAGQGVRRRNRL